MKNEFVISEGSGTGWHTAPVILALDHKKNHAVSGTEFQIKCLAYLDEIEQNGVPITITRRGAPVTTPGWVKRVAWKSPRNSWATKGRIVGDIANTHF